MTAHRGLSQLSISQLAALTGMHSRTVVKRLEGLEPAGTSGHAILYRAREAFPKLYGYENPLAEKMRLDAARAEAQEMKNAVARGELLVLTEVARVGTEIVAAIRTRVMGLRTLGPACRAAGSDAEAAELIESGAREALAELAALGELAERTRRVQRAGEAAPFDDSLGADAAFEADDERVGGSGAEAQS